MSIFVECCARERHDVPHPRAAWSRWLPVRRVPSVRGPAPWVMPVALCVCFALGVPPVPGQVGATNESNGPAQAAKTRDALETLVTQLGSDEPLLREHAEQELLAAGIIAFEILQDATDHEDIEIRLRARYVLEQLRHRVLQADAVPGLERLLSDLWSQPTAQRFARVRVALLAAPADSVAVACQFARFERSELHSKKTAAFIMQQTVPVTGETLAERKQKILRSTGVSNRKACELLRCYAASLTDPADQLERFGTFVQQQEDLQRADPDRTDLELVNLLRLAELDMVWRADLRPRFNASVLQLADRQQGNRLTLWELVDWLLARDQAELVLQLTQEIAEPFASDRLLRYRAAQAAEELGRADEAKRLADEAFGLAPESNESATSANELLAALSRRDADELQDPQDAGSEVAAILQQKGLLPWAEREYRRVLDSDRPATPLQVSARIQLSEMLHDHGHESEAAAALAPIAEPGADGQAEALALLKGLGRDPGEIVSRWRFFRALEAVEREDYQAARDELRSGIEAAPTDADVLIAMYRLPAADDAWKQFTAEKLAGATAVFRRDIRNAQRAVERNTRDETRLLAAYSLANVLNQFAWLVGNTEGDIEEAIRYSRQSLELRPTSAGLLDTLGRCYYRAGDLENALRYQRQAVNLEPYSGQIREQLELFESEAQTTPATES